MHAKTTSGAGRRTASRSMNEASAHPRAGRRLSALAVSPDGRLLARGHENGSVVIWDTESGSAVGPPLQGGGRITDITFSPDGHFLASANLDGSVILWDVEPAAWAARACSRAKRTLSANERVRFLGSENAEAACDSRDPPA